MKTLHLHIDRIVVEGLSPAEQRRFSHALDQELRLLAQSGVADQFEHNTRRQVRSLNAGVLQPGASGVKAAKQVAASIRNSLTRGQNQSAGTAMRGGGEGRNHV